MATAKPKLPTIAELNALVIAEAKKLKKNATKEELDKLEFNRLNTRNVNKCIYGQMTGYCFNDRAISLIEQSCTKVLTCDNSVDEIRGFLNGSPKKTSREKYWSPIEVFIDRPRNKTNGNNKRLVAFLKGETKTLILK